MHKINFVYNPHEEPAISKPNSWPLGLALIILAAGVAWLIEPLLF
jgi:hypothetical protein